MSVAPLFPADHLMVVSEKHVINDLQSCIVNFLLRNFPFLFRLRISIRRHALALAEEIIEHLQVSIRLQVCQEQHEPFLWLEDLYRVNQLIEHGRGQLALSLLGEAHLDHLSELFVHDFGDRWQSDQALRVPMSVHNVKQRAIPTVLQLFHVVLEALLGLIDFVKW